MRQYLMGIMEYSTNFRYTRVVCQGYFHLSISVIFGFRSIVNAV